MPSSKMSLDFKELDMNYSKMLEACHFAGEIVLSRDELVEICNNIPSFSGYINEDKLRNLLLVLTVNIAYYYYDDEGFWKHFYKLCKFRGEMPSTERIGKSVEKALLDKELVKYKRVGPFRYVGAILEQTGITNRNIPVYSQLIKELVRLYGVRNLRNITFQRYSSVVGQLNCSKYLREYLLDEAGWDFTLYAIKILYYYENGVVNNSDLYKFRGIHPQFWQEFFKNYSTSPSKNNKSEFFSLLMPLLIYDEMRVGIYLKFPTPNFTVDQLEVAKTKADKIYIHLNSIEKFISKYTGTVMDKGGEKQKWQIHGWDPSIDGQAYFHKKYGYVKDIENLYDGNYFLITNNELNIQKGKIIKRLGYLKISNKINFSIFEVNINKIIDVSNNKVELKWKDEKNRLPLNSYFDIFIDDLPNLIISNVSLLKSDRLLLFFDIGDGIKRIRDYENLSEIKDVIKDKKVVQGQIWVESMNRTRDNNKFLHENSLKFCVLPSFELSLPNELYSIKDKIEFKSNSPYIIYQNSKQKENYIWTIDAGVEMLEGRIQADKVEVYFSHIIYRSYMVVNQAQDTKYLDNDTLLDSDILTVYGKPLELGDVIVYDGVQNYKLLKSIHLDESGQNEFRYSDIKDIMKKLNLEAGKFYFQSNGRLIDSNLGYFNFLNIFEDLHDINDLSGKIRFIREINENVAQKVTQILSLLNNKQNSLIYVRPDKKPHYLDKIYEMMLIFSQVFDGITILDEFGARIEFNLAELENKEVIKTMSWCQKAMDIIKKANVSNIAIAKEEYNCLNWYPKVERWKDKIEKIYLELENLNNTKKIYIEWAEETRRQKRFHLKSNIACRIGGNQLTIAWMDYLKGNYMSSINKLAKVDYNSDSIVGELKLLLQATIYLKLTRISAMKKITSENNFLSKEVQDVINIYSNIYRILSGQVVDSQEDLKSVIAVFPFRQDDAEVLYKVNILFNKQLCNNILEQLNDSGNWIVNLIACRIYKDKDDFEKFKQNLVFLMDTIPESPEKENLLKVIIN